MSRREFFASLCAMVFLVNFARVVFAPLLQPVAADFGVTPAALGVVTSAAWLGSAASRLPAGLLLTRFPRHRVVAGTGALLVATATVTATSPSIPFLTGGAFLMGLSSGLYFVAANPLVSELFPGRVGRFVGIHGMAAQFAAVLAPIAVGAVLLVSEWRTTFLGIAGLAAVVTAFAIVAARRVSLPEAGVEDRSLRSAGRAQWPIILTGVAFIGSAGFLWNGLFNLYGDYLTVVKGVEPATGRLLLSTLFVAGVPAFVVTGRLAETLPNVPLLVGVVGVFVAGVLALTVVGGFLALAAVSFLIGYAFFSIPPTLDTYLLTSIPDHQRGSAYAIYSATMMAVQAMGSGVVGLAVVAGATYTGVFRVVALAVGGIVVVLYGLYLAGRLPRGGPTASTTGP